MNEHTFVPAGDRHPQRSLRNFISSAPFKTLSGMLMNVVFTKSAGQLRHFHHCVMMK